MSSPGAATTRLSWRIPTTGDPRLLRLALAQVALATIVAALVLLVAGPREWLGPALAGLIPLAIFMAYRRWHTFRQSLAGPDNVRIDSAGMHWLDSSGQEQTMCRSDVCGFRIGHEEGTLRPVPALTLYLAGGFESQPIELHPPATPAAVRHIAADLWNIPESPAGTDAQRWSAASSYDFLVDIYSECHDDYHEWHWEGSREELTRFFSLFQSAADELPPPPPGAKPAQRIILARRRTPTRLRLAHAPVPFLEHDLISGPAALLREIAGRAGGILEDAPSPGDIKFDLPLGPKDVWTFHLHVREA
jgi:hypothetical protein